MHRDPTQNGRPILNGREEYILNEANGPVTALLDGENPHKPSKLDVYNLIAYAAQNQKSDPSNACDAVRLALEMFGDLRPEFEVDFGPYENEK